MALDGRTILIVEDEFLIAFDLQNSLENAGAIVVGPAETETRALDLIDTEIIFAAILDINLGNESSKEIAVELSKRNIPFLYHTGQDSTDVLLDWPCAHVVSKPSTPSVMIDSLVRILNPNQ